MFFEIGDRVFVTSRGHIDNKNIKTKDSGKVVDIVEFKDMFTICVEFDRYIKGHNANGLGKDGHCAWVAPKSLMHERDKK